MRNTLLPWLLCLSLPVAQAGEEPRAAARPAPPTDSWPAWRGPLSNGVAPGADPPVEWSESRNVVWKTPLPGLGHSTPIVWGERIFLTTAVPFGEAVAPIESKAPGAHDNIAVTHRHRFVAMAVSRDEGRILWETVLREALPLEGGHRTASLASASAVTDGEMVFVPFGSYGLHALDFDGKVIWKRDFGPMQILHGHGEGSSPVLHGGVLAVNWDHEGDSFVAVLDKKTGRELWKAPRKEVTSWATPLVVEHGGKAQLVVSGTSRVRGYDLATGSILWECGGLSANIVASPVAGDGMVFVGSSYDTRALLAIRLDGARGDITATDRVAWRRSRGTPYVPSPLLYDGALYFLAHYQGILTRVQAGTGEERSGPIRLDGIGDVYASPVAAAGRIYITDLQGMTAVVEHGDAPRVIARNLLDDSFSASAAIAGREMFLRGRKSLYCIARR